MKPFTLHVPDAAIADLRERLARTRLPDEPPLPPWSIGTSVVRREAGDKLSLAPQRATARVRMTGSAGMRCTEAVGTV